MKKANANRLAEGQAAELRALEESPDEQIDTTDILKSSTGRKRNEACSTVRESSRSRSGWMQTS